MLSWDQDRDLGLQVSRPRPRQNELECNRVSRPWSRDHNTDNIHNVDIPAPAYLVTGCPGKWLLNEYCCSPFTFNIQWLTRCSFATLMSASDQQRLNQNCMHPWCRTTPAGPKLIRRVCDLVTLTSWLFSPQNSYTWHDQIAMGSGPPSQRPAVSEMTEGQIDGWNRYHRWLSPTLTSIPTRTFVMTDLYDGEPLLCHVPSLVSLAWFAVKLLRRQIHNQNWPPY